MKVSIKQTITNIFKSIDYKIVFVAISLTLMLMYYINPLVNASMDSWDRTFSTAMLDSISIDKRIQNFYVLFLGVAPILFICISVVYGSLVREHQELKNGIFGLSVIMIIPTIAAYISKYALGEAVVNQNSLLQTTIMFYIILIFAGLLDIKKLIKERQIYFYYIAYLVATVSVKALATTDITKSVIVVSVLYFLFLLFVLKNRNIEKLYGKIECWICFLMWIPALVRLTLEGLYLLNEKDIFINRYYTIILVICVIYSVLSFAISLLKKTNFSVSFGYIGAIVSLGCINFFGHSYQYVWNYGNYSNIYEQGNPAVAIDTLLNGKIPIIDNFSAHALSDVWTRIIYCIIHSDIKGIFADPYGGLASILGIIVLYFVLKKVLNSELSALIVCVFPYSYYGIKATSFCFIAIVVTMLILERDNVKNNLIFWCCLLIGAFYIYDEGIIIGVACIASILISKIIQKEWNGLKRFILSGIMVATVVVVLCLIYCLSTGVSPINRILEWMSVSLNSSTTWATNVFANANTFQYLFAYYVAPLSAVFVLGYTIIDFIKNKENKLSAFVTIAFAIAELIYISRTIIFHNLAVCNGITGVLFNFWHWTMAMFGVYLINRKTKDVTKIALTWCMVFGVCIILEGLLVTQQLPTESASIYNGATEKDLNLNDNMSVIWNQDRIVYGDETVAFINQFDQVFDLLLDDNETFLDFANITSLYVFTERERPSYVSQTPSLLTDLESQKYYLEQVQSYDVPLAVLGNAQIDHIQTMFSIPHNIRYYTIAEYIYQNYRPLVATGDFAIWCEKDRYDEFKSLIESSTLLSEGYTLLNYGYDALYTVNENGEYVYNPSVFHTSSLRAVPYIWANYDDYDAINGEVLEVLEKVSANKYCFSGSQNIDSSLGNYIAFEYNNENDVNVETTISFEDSTDLNSRFEYTFTAYPGEHTYLIRVSQDSSWWQYNVDTVQFWNEEELEISNIRILQGD